MLSLNLPPTWLLNLGKDVKTEYLLGADHFSRLHLGSSYGCLFLYPDCNPRVAATGGRWPYPQAGIVRSIAMKDNSMSHDWKTRLHQTRKVAVHPAPYTHDGSLFP